jgi:hypothetical protein
MQICSKEFKDKNESFRVFLQRIAGYIKGYSNVISPSLTLSIVAFL